jgi:uncharacterized membrane protein (UPF0136 family)
MGVGGVMGFARKRSAPSLIAGLSLAVIYAYSYLKCSGEEQQHGIRAGLVASCLLSAAMLSRAMKTRGVFPITMSTVGIASIVAYWSLM